MINLSFTPEQLDIINRALTAPSYTDVASLIGSINAQIEQQNQRAQTPVEATQPQEQPNAR